MTRKKPPEPQATIYALLCPDTRAVRYIGKADDPYRRLKSHMSEAPRLRRPVNLWLRRLRSDGKVPILEIIETCPAAAWPDRERHWIETYRQRGDGLLLNLAEGGDQPYCSPEVRAANGRRTTPEQGRQIWARVAANPKLRRLRFIKAQMMLHLRKCRLNAATDPEGLERHLALLRRVGRAVPHACGEWANIT